MKFVQEDFDVTSTNSSTNDSEIHYKDQAPTRYESFATITIDDTSSESREPVSDSDSEDEAIERISAPSRPSQ